jgi:hypothetical protein
MLPCKNGEMKQCCSSTLIILLLSSAFLPQVVLAAGDNTTLPEGTRIFLQLNKDLSTKKNSEGDEFDAVVTEPVSVGDRMVIPKGSVVSGSISRIQRPGRFKGKAVMTLLFQYISITGRGQKLPIVASFAGLDREGNRGVNSEGTIEGEGSEGRDIGTVLTPGLAGAGIGGLAGGGRGAGIGGGVGVAIGLATVFASRGKDIEMRRGSTMDISLDKPLSVPPETDATSARTH